MRSDHDTAALGLDGADHASEDAARASLERLQTTLRPPAIDFTGIDARASRYRRRRRAARGAAILATAGVVAGVAGVVPSVLPGGGTAPINSTTAADRAAESATAAPIAAGVPVSIDGRVEVVSPDGTGSETGLPGSVVGVVDDHVVVLDGEVLHGARGEAVPDVVAAFADADGVTYQTNDGRLHRSDGVDPVDVPGAQPDTAYPTLAAADANATVTSSGGDLTVRDADGDHRITLGSDGATPRPVTVRLAGDTLVVGDDSTVQIFDQDGTRRSGFLGGTTGALSPDGVTYAYAASPAERAAGMRGGLILRDTRNGTEARVPLPAAALQLTWNGGTVYVVTGAAAGGERTLWRCTTACSALVQDPNGTMVL